MKALQTRIDRFFRSGQKGRDLYKRYSYRFGQDFSGTNFSDVDFSDANFSDVDFSIANFSRANFSRAKFFRVDFSDAKFSYAKFFRVDFSDANFSDAKFSDVDFSIANFSSANFSRAMFSDVDFSSAKFSDAKVVRSVSFNIYKYASFSFEMDTGTRYIRLGCRSRALEEWESDFWDNNEEFPDDNSEKSNLRKLAFETHRKWFSKLQHSGKK